MKTFGELTILILSFVLFGLFHSVFASLKIKKIVAEKIGNFMAFYRFAYNLISVVFLYFILTVLPRPDYQLYDLNYPYDFLILIPQFAGLFGFFWSLKYFCVKEFLGLNQIKRFLNNEYSTNELDEKLSLRIEGPYKYIRHPLYSFSMVILIFRPTMDLFYLVSLLCIIAYFFIGSIYEENKLIAEFGNSYSKYKSKVPRFLPKIKINAPLFLYRYEQND